MATFNTLDENEIKREKLMSILENQRPGGGRRTMVALSFFVLMIGILISCFINGFLFFLRNMETGSKDIYSVVVDAGSTGTRVFAFHFKFNKKNEISGSNVKLEKEFYHAVEPGISDYISQPSGVAENLEPLLNFAQNSVPEDEYNRTLITFKATAGLRLVPREKGDKIIKEIRHILRKHPFYLPSEDKVMIMDGEEEGLFGWVTVNFLLDVIWDGIPDNTAAALDLGGGSVQTTFELPPGAELHELKVKDRFKVRLLHSEFVLFTHSYLGYGLKSARLGIMEQSTVTLPVTSVRHSSGIDIRDGLIQPSDLIEKNEERVLVSPCFMSDFNMTWKHQQVTYHIKGITQSLTSLTACLEPVSRFIERAHMVQSKYLWHREVHLFSFFYDVAVWAGMISPRDAHALLTPLNYLEAAGYYCDVGNQHPDHPFLCMDLLYIYSMLEHGLGIPINKQLHVEEKILGREVSWCLGAALSTLSNDFSYSTFIR